MTSSLPTLPFEQFIGQLKSDLADLFTERNQDTSALRTRGFNKEELKHIMQSTPLSVAIPSEHGGRGVIVKECLSVLETASYECVPLALIFGINIALFLKPFAKYGQEAPKAAVYKRFLEDKQMGGLMISEPLHGSDALSMSTNHFQTDDTHAIKGMKHWQGLSGDADFWLVAAREKTSSGRLVRDISMFLTDNHDDKQHIPMVEKYYSNGLYPISYGLNKIDIEVPDNHRLIPETTGIKMLMDVLHRSRLQFPGMALGFMRRAVEETTTYCNDRLVRGKSLLQFDQVNAQLAQMQNAFTICSAMCYRSSQVSGIGENLIQMGVEANTIKARVTDLMQNAAHTMTQLFGSSGYHIKNRGSRAIMDTRPFQIFEGPNEMLYSQISEAVSKEMKKKKQTLVDYFSEHEVTKDIAKFFSTVLNGVEVDRSMLQRKHVILGEVISRVMTAGYVSDMSESKFNKGLLDNAMDSIKKEVSELICNYKNAFNINPIINFKDSSSWATFA